MGKVLLTKEKLLHDDDASKYKNENYPQELSYQASDDPSTMAAATEKQAATTHQGQYNSSGPVQERRVLLREAPVHPTRPKSQSCRGCVTTYGQRHRMDREAVSPKIVFRGLPGVRKGSKVIPAEINHEAVEGGCFPFAQNVTTEEQNKPPNPGSGNQESLRGLRGECLPTIQHKGNWLRVNRVCKVSSAWVLREADEAEKEDACLQFGTLVT
ncbi:hypothetical protein NDU88_005372 [Pleurodeles waltl]|uniref:Uncharacterized protein n=1 Tax=Pleurodeles waltl TaxID=8319 RepID=A0AAV7W7M7_PLEWA|nr:hypothetical protein NDU88_005372 [Pleurodeles waltl]